MTDEKKRRGRGEGNLETLPSGKTRAVLSAGYNPDGTRKKLTATFDRKKDAARWLRDRLTEQSQGTLADAGRITLSEWLSRWLGAKKAKVEYNTWAGYEQSVRLYIGPSIGPTRLDRLTALTVETMDADLLEKGVPADARRRAATTLRTALRQAVRYKLIPANPAADVALPKRRRREIRPLTRAEALTLLSASARHRLQALFRLALDSGLRQGELFGLHWPEVDSVAGTVRVKQALAERPNLPERFELKPPKTPKGNRTVYVCRATCAALERHRQRMRREGRDVKAGPVFVTTRGGFYGRSPWGEMFRRVLKKARLPKVRPYDLRHTSATLLLAAGAGIKMVSERLGHEDIAITLRHYAGVLPGDQEQAAEFTEKIFGEQ